MTESRLRAYFAGNLGRPGDAVARWHTKLRVQGAHQIAKLFAFHQGAAVASTSIDARTISVAYLGDAYLLAGRAPLTPNTIAREILTHGSAAFCKFGGRFAIAATLGNGAEIYLAVDRYALSNIYFCARGSEFAFATASYLLATHPMISNRFALQAVYDYLYFHCLPGPQAGYSNMQRLLPGHFAHAKQNEITVAPYWEPRYRENANSCDIKSLQQLMSNATQARVRESGEIGCFLSGGLDSSTVTGYCHQHAPSRTVAYTIGFDAKGYDEIEFAAQAARHFGVEHRSYYVTPEDIVASLPRLVDAFDAPFGNASVVPTYYCAKLAKEHGCELLLAGDGGDELFGGNTRYARQLLLERYSLLPPALRRAVLEPLAETLPPSLCAGPMSKVLSYIEQAKVPLPARLMSYNLLHRVAPSSFLTDDFLAAIDLSDVTRQLNEIYPSDTSIAVANRLLQLDWRLTLADSDLPKVTQACALAGIDVRFPILDEALFDFASHLPWREKIGRSELRPFYRRAFESFLPPSTLSKSKHGFGLPFGVWLANNPKLIDTLRAATADLESRKILKPDFHKHLESDQFKKHAGYYGTLAWLLICLSLWLRQRDCNLA